jgi:hypothetical protein
MSVHNIGNSTQNHFAIIFVFYTVENYLTVYLIRFVIGVGQCFLQLKGVKRPERCGNTHLDDMRDYVVKTGPDSVLPTSHCRTL